MWVLEISKNGRELIRAPVEQGNVLIGRSPACNVVLRFPGLRPVHFLLEWIGEGPPTPGEADWSLLDISRESAALSSDLASDQSSGMGTLLGKERSSVSGFEFRWLFDPLAETRLQKGVLSERLRQARDGEEDSGFAFFSNSQVLEIVTVDNKREKVTDIQHVRVLNYNQGYAPIPELPQVLLHTPSESRAQFSLDLAPDARAFLRGSAIRHQDLKETLLGPGDLLQVHWPLNDYYFRLVPEVVAPRTPRQIWKDPFYIWCSVALLLTMLLMFATTRLPRPEEDVREVVPPRIAQIQIRNLPAPTPTPAAASAPPIQEEIIPEPPPVLNAPVLKKPLAPQKNTAVQPVKKEPLPKPALPAKKEPVTKMGLLANLKNTKKAPTVRADKVLNQGLVSETVGGADGFVMKQPPTGVLGRKDSRRDSLQAASTEVKAGNASSVNSLGTLRGAQTGSLSQNLSQIRMGSPSRDNSANDSVSGGLERDTVKQTLRNYQKEVRSCYEKALLVKPQIQGRMVFQWTITPQGRTTALRMIRSQVGTPSLEKCVQETLQSVQWPKAANGRSTMVNFPFEFQTQR